MTAIERTELFIAGEPRASVGKEYYDVHNPARPNELVGRAALATVDDINLAVEAAHDAFPAWSALSYHERAEYLRNIAKVLTEETEEVKERSKLFTREHGKILRETYMELSRLGDRFLSVADLAERIATPESYRAPPFDTFIVQQPRGVAALIVPWNWPLSILGAKLPQALLAGNTGVIKPSENSPLAPSKTLEIIGSLLPKGVVNVVTGSASKIGDALVGHPKVRTVNFTGSVRIGKHVMRTAAENLAHVTLELGGNDAGLILQDANLDQSAFQRMYLGAFSSAGQVCMALKRVYVHASRYDEVVDGLKAACNLSVVGDGLLAGTTMGPVNNAKQLEVVRGLIDQARNAGAEVVECGTIPDDSLYYGGGYFQRPALVLDADPSLSVVTEEQFGPVLPIVKFDSEEQAIALANDTPFGLCSSVWTEDSEKAKSLAMQIEAGYTYVNGHGPMAQDNRAPFGGFKDSGIGRNLGIEGVLGFTESHAVSATPGFFDDPKA